MFPDPRERGFPLSMKVFFDGGCRPNPGEMEIAVVARGELYHLANAGMGCSEEAEWLALLFALDTAKQLGEPDIILLGDCAGIIGQATGAHKCRRAEFEIYRRRFQVDVQHFDRVRVRHIRRTQNLAGIALNQFKRAHP